MRSCAAVLLGVALAWAEDDHQALADQKGKPDPTRPGGIEIPDPGTKVEDPAVARQEVARFQKEWDEAEDRRLELLARLGEWDHALVLAEAQKYVRDKDHRIAVAAIVAVARQASSRDKAGGVLLKAFNGDKRTNVVCASLVAMGKLGYDTAAVRKKAHALLAKDTKETFKAAARYLGYVKDKSAFRALAEQLDEPTGPANPSSPTNPPASYWKEKWEDWARSIYYVRWAVNQLVPGETFETAKEAQDWAEAHGKEHGIEW
jgi:HEAT repeat protein